MKSGYAGGHVANPTYEQVCGKKTGHAEVVQVTFDPSEISYQELLEVFADVKSTKTEKLDRSGQPVEERLHHRIIDGADAARFLGAMKERLEEGAFDADLGT